MKKSISLILSITTILSLFSVGCKEEKPKLKEVTLNNVALQEYTIVYDEEDIFSLYCAENLSSLLEDVAGVTLSVVADTQAETANEILVGATNRAASEAVQSVDLKDWEYIFSAENTKIVLYAEDYFVGGAANHLVNEAILPSQKGTKSEVLLEKNVTPFMYAFETPKNVLLMIGDGMGDNHLAYAKQEEKVTDFFAESMPNRGKVTTYSYSVYEGRSNFTDSAAAATALATGHKTKNNFVGINAELKQVKNIRELAHEKGANTAILTTDKITGATPAGFIAHSTHRNLTDDIQAQIDKQQKSGSLMVAEGDLGDRLLESTKSALSKISADDEKFFIMVEEGYIDKFSHNQDGHNMCYALKRFNQTIAYAMEFTLMHPDTVLIVTADHETGGIKQNTSGKYAYTVGNHTNEDVSVFAMGKTTETLANGGTIDNIDIAKFMAGIYGAKNFGGESLQ